MNKKGMISVNRPTIELLDPRLKELEDEYIEFLTDICRIESPTEYKEGVDAVGRYFIDKAKARGWRIDVQSQPVSGDCVCITMNPDAKGAPICFSGHMDTVHPIGSYGDEPVSFADGKIYGPGIGDCKGGIAASFYAMAVLEDCGFKARPIKLILQSDEENSSRFSKKTTVEFMCDMAKGSVAVLNVEGGDGKKVKIERKGIHRYKLTVRGKACHSSKCYDGISAIREAAYKIIELEKFKDKDGTTVNCGLISGGTAENTVPEECTFTVDVRTRTAADSEAADKAVHDIAAHSYIEGTECEVTLVSSRVPMELCERNIALLSRINEIYTANGIDAVETELGTGGSDAADFTAHGLACIDAVGTWGNGYHTRNEWCYYDSIYEAAKRLALIAWLI